MDQGGLRLTLVWDGRRIVAAEVVSTRPRAARILIGQPLARALELVPRLFSLCGQAQGVAARLASAAARGEALDAESLLDAGRQVALEAIGEHLWRLLLDWPPLLGLPQRKDAFLAWRRRLLAVKDRTGAALLGGELARWLGAEAQLRIEPVEHYAVLAPGALLPALAAATWARQGIDDMFSGQPSCAGAPAETGVLARRFAAAEVARHLATGKMIAARLAARYADLHFLAGALIDPRQLAGWLDAAPVADGVGLACVETARGLLLHLIQVNDGRVGRYVIVAPTEWNFHPQGAFVREITGCAAASRAEAEQAARRLALALDPCVAYEVIINDA
ncbi:MAG: nickel-dependent hydrogenase large subunit [Rhodocyclaceae bacterium]